MKHTKEENSLLLCNSGSANYETDALPEAPPAALHGGGHGARGPAARLKGVTARVGEVLTSQVFLLSGLPLDKYLGVVGQNLPPPSGVSPVVLRVGQFEYRLIHPADGSVHVIKERGAGTLRAHIYTVPEGLVDDTLSCVALCAAKNTGIVEVALGYRFLVSTVGLDQKDLILWFGQSQSAISNKMRLCRLSAPVLKQFSASGLSERHGRALLSIETDEMKLLALANFIKRKTSSIKAEQLGKFMKHKSLRDLGREAYSALIANTLRELPSTLDGGKPSGFRSLRRELDSLRRSGVPVSLRSAETDDCIEVVIRLPKRGDAAQARRGLSPADILLAGFDDEASAGNERGGLTLVKAAPDEAGAAGSAPAGQRPVITFPGGGAPFITFPRRKQPEQPFDYTQFDMAGEGAE